MHNMGEINNTDNINMLLNMLKDQDPSFNELQQLIQKNNGMPNSEDPNLLKIKDTINQLTSNLQGKKKTNKKYLLYY